MIRSLLFLFLSASAFGQIYDLSEIEKYLETADEETLVVFDVDDVLIVTEDHFIHPYAEKTTHRITEKLVRKVGDQKAIDEITSLCYLLPKRILVENETPSLIRRLQERKIKTIALTACQTGKFGLIPKIEEWRIEDLLSFGIDFSGSFQECDRIELDELKSKKNNTPLFEKGILFSKGFGKGEVLKAFLDYVQFTPKEVIFIDDLAYNLDSVAKEMESAGIAHREFHYTGARRHYKEIDEALIEDQLSHLVELREWIPDDAVKKQRS